MTTTELDLGAMALALAEAKKDEVYVLDDRVRVECEWCNGEGFVVIAEQFERERTL